jgi:hypothetical protein
MKAAAPALANAATRQPMLAERMARLYAQVGRGVLAARAQRALPVAMREFDAGVKSLLASAASPEVRENYRLLELLSIEYRPFASRAPSVEGAEKLLERHEEVAWIAAKGARLMRDPDERGKDALREAGEARLQSQRIARLHLFRGWGTRSRNLAVELQQANAAFVKSMAALAAATRAAPEVAADLQLAENQYSFLSDAARRLEGASDPRPELELVAKTCDNILEVMERVANACEALPA